MQVAFEENTESLCIVLFFCFLDFVTFVCLRTRGAPGVIGYCIHMLIGGFQKLTLIDYPGKVATVVFTIGCNFRCSFCHNPELISPSLEMVKIGQENEEAFFAFLKKRRGLLDGVCVTGGEPTVQRDLIPFLGRVKKMGFLVKLDTNGLRPEALREVLQQKLVDYIAMDVKHAPKKYALAMGAEIDMEKIKESVEIIKKSGLPYEFRTTVVPGIHTEGDFEAIGKWIRGAKRYYLQPFRPDIVFDPKVRDEALGKTLDFENIKNRLKKYGIDALIRG